MDSQHYHTSGYAAGILGITPQRFVQIATEIGILPAMTLNGLAYYDDDALQRVLKHLKQTGEPSAVRRLTTPGRPDLTSGGGHG